MRRRLIQFGATLLAIAAIVGLVYLFGLSGQTPSPMFVVYDKNHPNEALAVYPDSRVLKKHNVSADKFEAAFRAQLDAVGEAIAQALSEMFSSEPSEQRQNKQSAKYDESRFGLTSEAFQELLETTRMERWAVHSDGTHTVMEELSGKKSTLRKHDSALPSGKSLDEAHSKKEGIWQLSIPPTTLEEARKTFSKNTGITWPNLADDVHFDEDRVPLLGDGLFYIVFTVPPKSIQVWLESPPPWDMKRWLHGPIPPEVGSHCGFGFQRPSGWSTKKDGSKEYVGGAPEILEILKSKAVWYVARNRGPTDNP